MNDPISTYIINLKSRPERKSNILKELKDRNEFAVTVVEAIRHKKGAIGLWQTINHILTSLICQKEEFVLICEDDHKFTNSYSVKTLCLCIEEARKKEADIICGGLSWFQTGIQVSEHLFWIEKFSGLQFTIIFKKFYQKILDAEFSEYDAADYKISELTDKKFAIYPFISIQKDFGHSDVTHKNNGKNRVEKLFEETSERLGLLRTVRNYYLSKF